MKVLSINVGLSREIEWQKKIVRTSIFKSPVSGSVRVNKLNFDGDAQSDLSVHGGPDKAVYVYPYEHYSFWRDELPQADLSLGAFGENLTTEGLLEDVTNIGDTFRIGSAEFIVTQPRMPCYKLGIRFGRADMVKRFLHSGRTGFYLSVSKERDVSAGDSIEKLSQDEHRITVADIAGLYVAGAANQELLQRVSELPSLPAGWRGYFKKRIWNPDA